MTKVKFAFSVRADVLDKKHDLLLRYVAIVCVVCSCEFPLLLRVESDFI